MFVVVLYINKFVYFCIFDVIYCSLFSVWISLVFNLSSVSEIACLLIVLILHLIVNIAHWSFSYQLGLNFMTSFHLALLIQYSFHILSGKCEYKIRRRQTEKHIISDRYFQYIACK